MIDNLNETNKELLENILRDKMILEIKSRIDSEYNKHSKTEGLDWSLLASQKIFYSYNITKR